MRTLLAPGPKGSPIRVLSATTGACVSDDVRVLFARIQPAAAQGGYDAGEVDEQGFGLHLRYTITAEDGVPHTNYPGVEELESTRELVVEFGSGTHYLNYPGEVVLVGGKGLWLVDLQVVRVRTPFPHWHWLLQQAPQDRTFQVPHGHTVVGCYNGTATLTVNDVKLLLSATPVPATGDIFVQDASDRSSRVWVFFGFFG
jgi:hypothetical protein